MIISDLSYLETVCEASNLVGGSGAVVNLGDLSTSILLPPNVENIVLSSFKNKRGKTVYSFVSREPGKTSAYAFSSVIS